MNRQREERNKWTKECGRKKISKRGRRRVEVRKERTNGEKKVPNKGREEGTEGRKKSVIDELQQRNKQTNE